MKTTISPFFIVMNRDAYDALSDDQRAVIDAAGRDAALNGQASQLAVAAKGLEAFATMPGKEVITLSPDEAAALDARTDQVIAAAIAEAGGHAQSIVDALKAQ